MSNIRAFRRIQNMQVKLVTIPTQGVFNNMSAGFIAGGNSIGKDKRQQFGSGGAIARMERRITMKLKAVSVENPQFGKAPTEPPRLLVPSDTKHVLEFTIDEFKMLETYLNAVEWSVQACDDVADLFDCLDGS